jgi:hypothetical protein
MSLQLIIAGIVALAIAGLTAAMYYYKSEAATAGAERDLAYAQVREAVNANHAQADVIARLKQEAADNDKLLSELADDIAALRAAQAGKTKSIVDLKDADPATRDYLTTPLPPGLDSLLNK